MAFVITSPCHNEKAAYCVDVCPADCIMPGEDQFYINPMECIDCGACETACPVEAIFHEDDLLSEDMVYLQKAKQFYGLKQS